MGDAPWPAPAKLNRFLHIVGRRTDGYHLLQTVFQFLDVSDQLHIRVRHDGRIRRLRPLPQVAPQHDLSLRAARLLQEHTGSAFGVDIDLVKHVPQGGGLGGGSSDAATVLVALNRLWQLQLPQTELASLALSLGADVPVFVHGQAAWAEGVGEKLTAVTLDQPWFLVLNPGVTVPTAEVFADPQLTRNSRPITISDFLSNAGGNDCEAVVRRRYPAVNEAMAWLQRHAQARLTGTGACIFAAFPERRAAEQVLAGLPPRWSGFIAAGLNRSPLLARLEQEG